MEKGMRNARLVEDGRPSARTGKTIRSKKGKHPKMTFRKFIKTPKGIVFSIIAGLTCVGLFYPNSIGGVINIFIAVFFALFFDFVVAWFYHRSKWFSDGALITGLIIGGILSPQTPWYVVIFTTASALLFKHVFKDKRKPIFNPAAAGLLVNTLFFANGQSWWNSLSMLPVWSAVLLIIGGAVIAQRINKFPLVFSFLGTYMLLFLIAGLLGISGAGDALRVPYISAALFLAFFMLTDPPTSPGKYKEQMIFGFLAGAASVSAFFFLSKLSYLLVGLLFANVWKAWAARSHNVTASRPKKKMAES